MTTNTYANSGNCYVPEPRISLAGIISSLLAYLKHKERQYRDLRYLSELADYQLQDIGLQRADIRDAVFGRSLDQIRNEDALGR